MTIGRRRFLELAGLGGLALAATPLLRVERARAAITEDTRFWIHIFAMGGWDTRMFFDPTLNPAQNRVYTEIESVGDLSYAPIPLDLGELGLPLAAEPYLMSNAEFLARYHGQFTYINGIDTATINHTVGQRVMGSGQINLGYPSFGTVVASAKAPDALMAYCSGGGYDTTADLLPLVRLGNVSHLKSTAHPNTMEPENPASSTELFHTTDTMDRIRRVQDERLRALGDRQHLPRVRNAMDRLLTARANDTELALLELPDMVELGNNPAILDLEQFLQQSQLVLEAFTKGLCVSANLTIGLFDTHVNNDMTQRRQLAKLLGGIDFLMTKIAEVGLQNRVYVVVTSDFGRTPWYNNDTALAGKDHWPVTSMMAHGPDIPGGRLIGAQTDDQLPRLIDPQTLQVVDGQDGQDGQDGVRITPASIHRALRKKAGIDSSPAAERFPIVGGDELALFD